MQNNNKFSNGSSPETCPLNRSGQRHFKCQRELLLPNFSRLLYFINYLILLYALVDSLNAHIIKAIAGHKRTRLDDASVRELLRFLHETSDRSVGVAFIDVSLENENCGGHVDYGHL
jgi:hypothetical protein